VAIIVNEGGPTLMSGLQSSEEKPMAAPNSVPTTPTEIVEATPHFAKVTREVLFSDVWQRADLSPRDRSLLTCAAVTALNRAEYLGFHGRRALDNGVTPRELAETVAHLAFYCGWPMATAAAFELHPIWQERGIAPGDVASLDAPLLDLEPEAEAARLNTVATFVAPTSAGLAKDTDDVLFADLWRRQDLAPRDRSLITVTALIAMGQPEQLGFHVNRAMDNGLTEAELGGVLSHLAYYVGWPRAMSAVGAVRAILDARNA
jgi:4-carboxymuconolactone decarboxylase